MTAPIFDQTEPDPGASAWNLSIDATRENLVFLMIAAGAVGYMLPGWSTTVNGTNKAEPDSIVMAKGSLQMKWLFTWSSGKVTQIIWQYDRGLGAGLETLTGGTITPSYDGSNNFIGATSA